MVDIAALPKFRGSEDEDVLHWLRKLEQHMIAADCVEEARKLAFAQLALSGLAEAWASSRQFQDFAEFSTQIAAEYPCNLSSLVLKIESLRQGGAPVAKYAQDALNLHARLPTGTMSESLLVKHFVRGLNSELRPAVDMACPETVHHAISAARYTDRKLKDPDYSLTPAPEANRFNQAAPGPFPQHEAQFAGPAAPGWRPRPDNRGPLHPRIAVLHGGTINVQPQAHLQAIHDHQTPLTGKSRLVRLPCANLSTKLGICAEQCMNNQAHRLSSSCNPALKGRIIPPLLGCKAWQQAWLTWQRIPHSLASVMRQTCSC